MAPKKGQNGQGSRSINRNRQFKGAVGHLQDGAYFLQRQIRQHP